MAVMEWTWLVGGYLALAGAGAGSYLTSAVADLMKSERYKPLVKPGFYVSFPIAALGTLLLILDLGRPERFMNVFNSPDTSILSLGAYLLTFFVVLTVITTALWAMLPKGGERIRYGVEIVGAVFAFGVAIYIGLLLGAAIGRPFWFSPVLPWLLFASSITMGLAATGLVLLAQKDGERLGEIFKGLHRNDIILLAAEVIAITAFMATAPDPIGVSTVVIGALAPAFYGGVVLMGIAIPLGIDAYALQRERVNRPLGKGLVALGLVLLITGGVILRFVILFAGQL